MPTPALAGCARVRFPRVLLLLLLFCAFSFGAIVRIALADNYHVTCVGHGFVSGASLTDGSFFSRVEPGCGSTYRYCAIYSAGVFRGSEEVANTTSSCNAWSRTWGDYRECSGSAHIHDPGVFSDHFHLAPNWCG